MKLKLKDIQPNPFRDFSIDPINPDAVDSLKRSIDDHEFWNGLLVRKLGKRYQLVFGHHRLEAAKLAGIEEIEVPVVDWSDDEVVRAMCAENATQRSTNFSACANDVAAAMRVLGYAMLTNDKAPEGFGKIFQKPLSFEKCKGRFLAGAGLGKDLLYRYFDEQLSMGDLRESIAQLKAANKIAEITNEIIDAAIADGAVFDPPEIESKEPEFDMAVGQILNKTNHLQAFRNVVTTLIAKQVLPVSGQVKLAKQIVKEIHDDEEAGKRKKILLNAVRIRSRTNTAIMSIHGMRRLDRDRLRKESKQIEAQHHWSFARNKFSHANTHALQLEDLLKIEITPEGFNSEKARQFFDNEFKQCVATFERIKKLLPITI